MTRPTSAETWRAFEDLPLEAKERVLDLVRSRLMHSGDAPDEELRPLAFLLPVLEMKIEEHRAAGALQELLDGL